MIDLNQLFTIGHSTYPEEHLFLLLKQFQIDYVLDVRSVPFSRHAPQYNSNYLHFRLKKIGVGYLKMGDSFGARWDDRSLFHSEGYLDFEKVRATELFRKGKDRVLKGLENYNLALMCTEKDPINCHRSIMVAREFELEGVSVRHILHMNDQDTGKEESQSDFNQRLLDLYFPERNQISLFSTDNLTEEEYLVEAYRKRNCEIGYRWFSESEGGAE